MTEAKRKVEPRAVRLANRVQKAVDDGTDTVEEIHKKVASVPLSLLEQIERFKTAARDLHKLQDRSIGVVYKVVRDINHDVIRLVKKLYRPALGWVLSRGVKPEPVKGLYIWGAVGRGKTMLMDQFHAAAPNDRKLRTHFHEFMADVHDRIHRFRQALKAGNVKGDDPIAPVAAEIAAETSLLSFDEFFVTDIADAMILGRLFEAFFAFMIAYKVENVTFEKTSMMESLQRADRVLTDYPLTPTGEARLAGKPVLSLHHSAMIIQEEVIINQIYT